MAPTVTKPSFVRCKINQNGRIVIPAAIRQEMGLKAGESLLMEVEDGVLRIESHRARIRRIQEEIAERREEARREEEELQRDRAEHGRWTKVDQVA